METMREDEYFMALAIEEAKSGAASPGAGEVGCVIVRKGAVAAVGYNEAELRHDPTAHAEIVTMRRLGERLQSTDFRGCTLYCTLQPCSMCAVACIWGKISRIVFGAGRDDVHSMYFDTKHINAVDLIADAFREDLVIVGGVLRDRGAALYYKPADSPPIAEQDNV
jgi:tRNA(adenine34) deaminase